MSDLYALVRRRMADERVEPGDPVAVAELHRRLVPYHACRDRLGFATKAEYDAALLRFLADEGRVQVAEPALREAVQAEIRQPEPGLAFLHRYAASEIRLRADSAEAVVSPVAPTEVEAGPVEAAPGAPVEPPPDAAAAAHEATGRDACRRCDATMPAIEGVRFCPACGTDQIAPTCDACGAEVDDDWKFCAFCGSLRPPASA